jgi:uncharacterized membrane protein YdjX (TVP38/TMEM64 family)
VTMLDDDERVFESDRARRRALASATALVLGLAASAWLVHEYAPFLLSATWARETVRDFGPWAPVAYTSLQVIQVVFAPIPGQTLGFLGGYLFGAVAGTAYSMLGVVVGSWVVFRLARTYGRSAVESWMTDAVLERFDGFVDETGEVALFVVFLLPAFPDDAICFLAGLSELRERRFLLLLVVGRFPSFAAVAVAGDRFARDQLLPFVAVATAVVVLSVVGYARRDLFERAVERAAAWQAEET